MKYATSIILFFFFNTCYYSQSLDDSLSYRNMFKDLEVFQNIRLKANSGLYKHRTKAAIDSIYRWAFDEIKKPSCYRDFYNIICKLTDFEGSLHNDTSLPSKVYKSMKNEETGYFPYPLKLIEGKLLFNMEDKKIPLGAEIVSINQHPTTEILSNFYKYYTTDGFNISGKSIGINYSFSRYYRINYGLSKTFDVVYKVHNLDKREETTLSSISYKSYYDNVQMRFSKPFDEPNFKDWGENEIYSYRTIDEETGLLTVNDFGMGNEEHPNHLKYVHFLDSIFFQIKQKKIHNLIVDIRYNGGGTDPNDLVTYSYLTQRSFTENKEAWISFNKFPYLKYAYTKIPRFLRPLGVRRYNKMFASEFPIEKNGRYYEGPSNPDHKIREPNKNSFTGNIYLLISPRVASAGSLFAAMVAGNSNTITIGEETMGGYYGHNGHTPIGYILPKSKIETFFSIVNLEQDVPQKDTQIYSRGILPDYTVFQNYDDYILQVDTQMNFVINFIKSRK